MMEEHPIFETPWIHFIVMAPNIIMKMAYGISRHKTWGILNYNLYRPKSKKN